MYIECSELSYYALTNQTKASIELSKLMVRQKEKRKVAMDSFKSSKLALANQEEEFNRRRVIEVGLNCKIVKTDATVIKLQNSLKDLQEKLNL